MTTTTTRCSFAYPGTYGHECGKPATVTGIKPSDTTANGVFYAHRCADCAKAKAGPDNRGITRFEPLNPELHVNVWRKS